MNVNDILNESFKDVKIAADNNYEKRVSILKKKNTREEGPRRFKIKFSKSNFLKAYLNRINPNNKLTDAELYKVIMADYKDIDKIEEVKKDSMFRAVVAKTLREKAASIKPKSSSVRIGNEPVINHVMKTFVKKSSLPAVITVEGTKISEANLKKLKRDEKMTIEGLPPFRFEAKKADPKSLFGKNGLMFAEIRKLFSSDKKADILANPEKVKKVKAHNEKFDKDFTEEEIKKIKKQINTTVSKSENPYLLVGGLTPNSIKVLYPNQYWLDIGITTGYPAKRLEFQAKAKKGLNIDDLLSLPEFLNRMMVEETFPDFKNELLLREEGAIKWLD